MNFQRLAGISFLFFVLAALSVCAPAPETEKADLILLNGRVYTFTWDEPATDGTPAANAPHSDAGWTPDAEAVVVRGDRILFVGTSEEAEAYQGDATKVLDVKGATILPGLVDSHGHVSELGALASEVNLIGVETEEEAVELAAAKAATVPDGEWIIARGWDEGTWANRYPTMELISEKIPNHPVIMISLHGFGVWGNRMAFERAGITRETPVPSGGDILKDADGNPTGVVLNRAGPLLRSAIPEPDEEQLKSHILLGLQIMAKDGYVAFHQAGAGSDFMEALEALESENKLPTRVYAMLSARDEPLCRAWLERGPDTDDSMLTVRAVKAYYDASLGPRGARMLEDYSDRPGHRGVAGDEYGFNQALVAEMMKAGFQVGIHAIGDAGNRECLDFIESVLEDDPASRKERHRIEHAQIVHPDDFVRFAELDLIASMEPPHAVEDKTWAEDRVGPERIKGAYAWRTFRQAGVPLTFNADLAGSDHNIFYGLHAAMTRRDKDRQPPEGWYPEQNMSPEEALRGYTTWSAYAAHWEEQTGVLAPGRWADITVMDIDPLVLGETEPGKILDGSILATIVAGRVVHNAR